MKTLVVSLTETLYDGDTIACTLPTKNGEITILPHHRPLVSVLAPGIITLTDQSDKQIEIPIKAGFLEVAAGDTVHILLD